MMESNEELLKKKIAEDIKEELKHLPKGNLTYKTINGKEQPYLQWAENGKCHSVYVKMDEREQVMIDLDKRKSLERQLVLLNTYSVKVANILKDHPTYEGHPYVGSESFDDFRKPGIMYIDKTRFIVKWWKKDDKVTLIVRPRRFGKSLMFSTIEYFFSPLYKDRVTFDDLDVMKDPVLSSLYGTIPVIRISFAAYKTADVHYIIAGLCGDLASYCSAYKKIFENAGIAKEYIDTMEKLSKDLRTWDNTVLMDSFKTFFETIYNVTGKKTIVLIDEYDTPVQEAYMVNKWDQVASFYRGFINAVVKTNKYLNRALLTGVTQVAKESFYSDMNNITIDTVTSDRYAEFFGFTEEEVFNVLDCQDGIEKQKVKEMYDGFTFGHLNNIYNPWSIVNYIKERQFRAYWVMSGGISVAAKLILKADNEVKEDIKTLMDGGTIHKKFSESMTYDDLENDSFAVWTLLLCGGYVTAMNPVIDCEYVECDLRITNKETRCAYDHIPEAWTKGMKSSYSSFCKYMLKGDIEAMNHFMNAIALSTISVFDVGNKPGESAPERFYHGFVLGLLVELDDDYTIESNRESGFGRYDIMLIPKKKELDGIIIEFKVINKKKESSLEETAANALAQINEKQYEKYLLDLGVSQDKIRKYGFAFEGKEVLIVENGELNG